MHIVFLSPEYSRNSRPEGGLGNYLRKVSLALIARGHKVSIIFYAIKSIERQWNDNGINVFEKKYWTYSWRIDRIFPLNLIMPIIRQLKNAKNLENEFWKVHKEYPVDIIQTASLWTPAHTLVNNNQVPVICRLSSYSPLLRKASNRKIRVLDHVFDRLEAHQVNASDAAFAPSRFIAEAFKRFEGHEISIIRSPIEEIEIFPSKNVKNRFSDLRYLLFFGRLTFYKGADLLREALLPMLNKYLDLHVIFIGPDDGFNKKLKMFDYIKEGCVSFEDRLHYCPPLNKRVLYPIIRDALGVLIPSRVDNYPNSCLEAFSFGIPVIGTLDSSLEEMIEDGKTGFLAKNNDPVSLSNAIEKLLLLNDSQILKMKENITTTVNAMKTENRIEELINLYKETSAKFLG